MFRIHASQGAFEKFGWLTALILPHVNRLNLTAVWIGSGPPAHGLGQSKFHQTESAFVGRLITSSAEKDLYFSVPIESRQNQTFSIAKYLVSFLPLRGSKQTP